MRAVTAVRNQLQALVVSVGVLLTLLIVFSIETLFRHYEDYKEACLLHFGEGQLSNLAYLSGCYYTWKKLSVR